MSVFSPPNDALSFPSRSGAGGLAWLAILLAAAVPVFWLGFGSLAQAWSTPEYSHGPLIPLISLYLFLRELRRAPPELAGQTKTRWPGLLVILFALTFGIFGNLIQIPDVVTYAFIIWVMGVVLLGFGWERGRSHWAPVLHLIFMLPLPQIVYWQLSIFLQLVSSEIGVWLVRSAGVPVFLEGNIIDLGIYKLQVAEACSGLRYLFPILSFSYLFAILYRGPFWHKALLFLMAAPLTVLMNSVRIGIIGLLVNSYGIAHAEGFLHFFEGWVIFGTCIAILFLTGVGLQRLLPGRQPFSKTIDMDFDGFGAQARRLLLLAPSTGLAAGALLSVAVGAAFLLAPGVDRPVVLARALHPFPRPGCLERHALHAGCGGRGGAGRDRLRQHDLLRQGEAPRSTSSPLVPVSDRWSRSSIRPRSAPRGRLEMSSIEVVELSAPGTVYGDFTVNRAVIQKGLSQQLVYTGRAAREAHGQRLPRQASVVWDGLTLGRQRRGAGPPRHTDRADESEADADARMAAADARAVAGPATLRAGVTPSGPAATC
jgi:exosortase